MWCAGRRGSPRRRAALYATASGIVWAALATVIKSVTDTLAADGLPAVLTGGAVYGVVIAGIAGTLLTQAALHYGPLAISQPFMVIVNPLVSIILGVWLDGEHFTGGAPKIARCLGLRRNGDRCRVPRAPRRRSRQPQRSQRRRRDAST
jgi:hypothetical protein